MTAQTAENLEIARKQAEWASKKASEILARIARLRRAGETS